MPRVLNTSVNAGHGPHFDLLRNAGFDVDVVSRDINLYVEENLIAALKDYDAVVAGAEPYSRKVVEALPRLRVIARSGVGFDAIDLAACDEAKVAVTITPGVNHHAVAEHTIALLVGVACSFPELDRDVRAGKWKRIYRKRLAGSTLGIVGLGRIGQAVATRAIGLGLNVLAYEPKPNREFVDTWRIGLTGFDDLLRRSDYVSLHLPSMPSTRHLMNADTFAKMKEGSVLINTARGSLVDERALYDALKSGRLRGAGLDVYEVEPLPPESPLLEFENVLFSGHIAGLDDKSHHDTFTMVAETIIELYNGGRPDECLLNLKDAAAWSWGRGQADSAE